MSFLYACAMVVIVGLVLVSVGLIAWVMSWINDEEDDWATFAYIVSSIGFGVCLTLF